MSDGTAIHDEIVAKVQAAADRPGPGTRPDSKHPIEISVTAESLDGALKRAIVAEDVPKGASFAILSDEGEAIGGRDSAPTPLSYFSVSIAFCLMSQIHLYAEARKLRLDRIRVEQKIRFSVRGSRLRDTREVRCLGLETLVHVDSRESPDTIRELVAHGERTCFVLQSLINPVPLSTRATLNGEALALGGTRRRARENPRRGGRISR